MLGKYFGTRSLDLLLLHSRVLAREAGVSGAVSKAEAVTVPHQSVTI